MVMPRCRSPTIFVLSSTVVIVVVVAAAIIASLIFFPDPVISLGIIRACRRLFVQMPTDVKDGLRNHSKAKCFYVYTYRSRSEL